MRIIKAYWLDDLEIFTCKVKEINKARTIAWFLWGDPERYEYYL